MKTIETFEAQAHLPEVIKKAKHDIFDRLAKLKKTAPLGDINEIIAMRDERRR